MENNLDLKSLTQAYRALADETRLQILGLILHKGELCVCDVINVLEISQSKASRHLRYLFNAGFLLDRREGTWMHYRIHDQLHPERQLMLNTLKSQLTDEQLSPLFKQLSACRNSKNCETC